MIVGIVTVAVGAIIMITNRVPKYDPYLINNIEYKKIMYKIDDLDKRLKKIEK